MHILFHNNTIFNNWFFFMFSVAFLDRYHGTVPQASVIFNKNTQHVDTSFQTRLVAQIESFLFWTGCKHTCGVAPHA